MLQAPIETQGIKYAGSKRVILPSILEIAAKLKVRSICDGFAGTTRVGQAFSKLGYRVWSNDISDWSRVFGQCYLKNIKPKSHYQPMMDYLNALTGQDGWFTANYGGSAHSKLSDEVDGKKKLWQYQNTRKLDVIRPEIDSVASDEIEKSVLLASLILAMDKVDSSVGHQASYLREWAPRSYHTMKMEVPELIVKSNNLENLVSQGSIFEVLKSSTAELFYFDPPYGSSNEKMPPSRVRYASYYHVWTSVIRNDEPTVVGAANRRIDVSDPLAASIFEEFRRSEKGRFIALEALERLIREASGEYIVLSYNNQGRATFSDLVEVCSGQAKDLWIIERSHRSNVMRRMRWTQAWVARSEVETKEFLFVMGKNSILPRCLSM